MRTQCPVCNNHKTVMKPIRGEMVIGYCGPNGERLPPSFYEECQNCCGTGWVGQPGVNPLDPYLPQETE